MDTERTDTNAEVGTVVVTATSFFGARRIRRALRKIPDIDVDRTDFRAVLRVETGAADPMELAARIHRECAGDIGHTTAVFAEVESRLDEIRDAAARVGADHIGASESFAFRIQKRGSHWLREDTPELEREIGGAIWTALEEKHGREPVVDLEEPDVTVRAEVLGPMTALGISRKEWAAAEAEDAEPPGPTETAEPTEPTQPPEPTGG